MRALDHDAVESLGLPSLLLMENAAIGAADAIVGRLDASRRPGPVLIVAGPGNNGGDGIALARQLCIRGIGTSLILAAEPDACSPDAGANLHALRSAGVPVIPARDDPDALRRAIDTDHPAVLVDALLGTGLTRPVEGPLAVIIETCNSARRDATPPITVALDLPTGLDADTGIPLGHPDHPTFVADLTVTFAALKSGFFTLDAQPFLGEITLVPIGVPPAFVARFGLPYEPDRHTHARDHDEHASTGQPQDPIGPGRDARTPLPGPDPSPR